jgi:hypothetical protein
MSDTIERIRKAVAMADALEGVRSASMNGATVYLATAGEYEERHVIGVYATEAEAAAMCNAYGGHEPHEPTPMVLGAGFRPEAADGLKWWYYSASADGTQESARPEGADQKDHGAGFLVDDSRWENGRPVPYRRFGNTFWAKDEAAALAAWREALANWLAAEAQTR